MTKEELEAIQETIEDEGFDYAFVHYSSFKDIGDEKFHELRQKFVDAHNELWEYLKMDEFYENL